MIVIVEILWDILLVHLLLILMIVTMMDEVVVCWGGLERSSMIIRLLVSVHTRGCL